MHHVRQLHLACVMQVHHRGLADPCMTCAMQVRVRELREREREKERGTLHPLQNTSQVTRLACAMVALQ